MNNSAAAPSTETDDSLIVSILTYIRKNGFQIYDVTAIGFQ